MLTAGLAGCGARPAELSLSRAASRGVLAYAIALTDEAAPRLVSVELGARAGIGARFELIARSIDPDGGLVERARVPLGPPDWDVGDLAVEPGGRAALVASAAGTVRRIDLGPDRARRRVLATWHLGAAATAVAVSPDGRLAATGSASGVVCLRRLADGALLQCLVAHRGPVSGLDFDRRGARLASSSWDGRVAVWSAPALAALAEVDVGGSANQVAFSRAGLLAIAASAAPPRRSPAAAARERAGAVRGVDPGARVLVWRARRGSRPRAIGRHGGPVTSVAWVGTGRILSASWDRTVRLWDAGGGGELGRADGFTLLVRDVAVADTGRWAAAAAWSSWGEGPAATLLDLRHPP